MRTYAQTANSTARIIVPGSPSTWFDDTREAALYVAGFTSGKLGVFVDGDLTVDGRIIITFTIGQ